jgi:hypothetical protein
MPDYRVYFLDRQGHIHGARDLHAGDDAAAIGLARDHSERGSLEMWSGSRKVWRFDPDPETAGVGHDQTAQ